MFKVVNEIGFKFFAMEQWQLGLLDVGPLDKSIDFIKDYRSSWLSIGVLGVFACCNGLNSVVDKDGKIVSHTSLAVKHISGKNILDNHSVNLLSKIIMGILMTTNKNVSRTVGGNGSAFQQNCVSKEQKLTDALKKSLPGITYVSVEDISGGCGAMYEISIEAKEFKGLSTVKQHRLVTESLKSDIAEMHGIRIHTSPPKGEN